MRENRMHGSTGRGWKRSPRLPRQPLTLRLFGQVILGLTWGFAGLVGGCSGYAAVVSGMGVSRSSKARRWSGVGSASMGDVGVGAVVADLVAGEGGQVVEQAAEAAERVAVGVVFAGGLGVGVGGALGGGDGVVALGWVFVGEGQRRPGLAQVPDEVAGEHADQHVGVDAVVEAVVDRAAGRGRRF